MLQISLMCKVVGGVWVYPEILLVNCLVTDLPLLQDYRDIFW